MTPGKGVSMFTQCDVENIGMSLSSEWNSKFQQHLQISFDYYYAAESEWNCSGYCNISDFFTFTNISKGPPLKNCTKAGYDYVEAMFPRWAAISFVQAVVLVFGLLASCSICFSKPKSKKYSELA
mmetsp:Transcript_18366/g.17481  ORF Transcript_18366/g.17481 Transcript_18366/m.17481 type:complete len:125 (+) Transcript_18366:533-907(+)